MKKKLLAILALLALILGIFLTASVPGSAGMAETEDTILVFTSDVHHASANDDGSANRLKKFLNHVTENYGTVDALGVSGDLGISGVSETKFWNYVKKVITNVSSLGIDGIYTTGNHEQNEGKFSTTTNAIAKNYIRLGVGKSAANYEIYCFGAASTTQEFTESDISALAAYLKTVGTSKPVFILSHYPLHSLTYTEGGSQKTRDPGNRQKVIELLNDYPNVYFLWGHNHSKNDPYYDQVRTQLDDKDIGFVYAAAGSMTEPTENTYSGNIAGKCMVVQISEDGKKVNLRYLNTDYETIYEWNNTPEEFYEVVIGSQLEGTNLSVARVSGGGLISDRAGGYITAETSLEGFDFAGWYSGYSAENNGTLVSEDPEVKLKPEEDMTLTAVYRKNETVTFDVTVSAEAYEVDGEPGTGSVSCEPGDEVTVTFADSTRDFLFWQDGSGAILGRSETLTLIVTKDLSVNAVSLPKGAENTYAFVRFLDSEDVLLSAAFLSVYDVISFPSAPELPGMTFIGWDMTQYEIRKAMASSKNVFVRPLYQSAD